MSSVSLVLMPRAQQQPSPPVFRAATRLIVQTVSVKDKDGRAVEGLKAEDFIVTEDNEPQTVSFVDTLPTGLQIAAVANVQFTCTSVTGTAVGNTITVTSATLIATM